MKSLFLAVLIGISNLPGKRIDSYQTDAAESSMKITGTSTIHDWEMEATNMNGIMDVDVYEDKIDIKKLQLTIDVKSLKSGKSTMDKKAYDALKESDHPQIKFVFSTMNSLEKNGGNQYKLVASGSMNIAGQSRAMNIPVTAIVENGTMTLKGSIPIKMTDFGVKPPSFMFGSVNTGDQVTVQFNINYKSTSK